MVFKNVWNWSNTCMWLWIWHIWLQGLQSLLKIKIKVLRQSLIRLFTAHSRFLNRVLLSHNHTSLYDAIRLTMGKFRWSRTIGGWIMCNRATSHDTVRRRGSSHDICAIDVRWRHTTSSMIVQRRKTQSRIVRHRTTVIRSSDDHRSTLIYKTILASHHAIIVKPYVIVRLSHDYRSTVVRCRTIYLCFSFSYSNHSEVVRNRTTIVRLSYDVVRCSTISQKLSMYRKPIVSGVTTHLRLQYRSRIGEHFFEIYDVTHRTTSQPGVTKALTDWEIQKVLSWMLFMCLSSHWKIVYAPSNDLPMYQILKQSDNWLWRYLISKIWEIQQVSSRMQLF